MSDFTVIPTSCTDCGLCCHGIGSPVLVYQTDHRIRGAHPLRPADLPDDLLQEINTHFQGLQRGQEPQERCLWFDDKKKACRHYEWRPQVCRDYQLGGTACLGCRKEFLSQGGQISTG